MTRMFLLLAAAPLLVAAPVAAQTMGSMPGMNMPGTKMPPKSKKPTKARPAARTTAATGKKPVGKPGSVRHRKSVSGTHARAAAKPQTGRAMSGMAAMPGMRMPAKPHGQRRHKMSAMPGMAMPVKGHAAGPAARGMSAMPGMNMPASGAASPSQGGQDMSSMPGMQMPAGSAKSGAGQDMQNMPGMHMNGAQSEGPMVGTNLPAGNALAPPPPRDHAADLAYPAAEMAAARRQFATEHGGGMTRTYSAMFNLAEYQAHSGRNGFRWDGEGWYGSDVTRLFVKTEGGGTFKRGVESAEGQALFSRAIDPYWNLQAGIRYDFEPRPSRAYATIGVEGLAPHFVETEAALFLSTKGDLLARAEGWYDQRVTQRLILQPRVEANFAAQNVPADRIGSGIVDLEAGLRLRYEVRREFGPYVGFGWDRKLGNTARFARAAGEGTGGWSAVFGIRTWF